MISTLVCYRAGRFWALSPNRVPAQGVFSTALGVTNWHSRSPPAGRCLVFKYTSFKGVGELVAPQGDGFCFGFGMSDEHI